MHNLLGLRKILYAIRWSFWVALWPFFYRKHRTADLTNTRFSIGVTTYAARYNTYFKRLILQLSALFPDTEIVVSVNGYYDPDKQRAYLRELHEFLIKFPHVRYSVFEESKGLSSLWNRLIDRSSHEKIIVLNDDLELSPLFRFFLERSAILDHEVAVINKSWSHYLISRSVIGRIGWFDENFPAIGNEDWDYACRLTLAGQEPVQVKVRGIRNIEDHPDDFSYGNDLQLVNGKYARTNRDYFYSKWILSPEPRDGFVFVEILGCYVKLKAA